MSETPCGCPNLEGLSFYEIITVTGLTGRKQDSKNCCEPGGYICPNLDRALRSAYSKEYALRAREERTEKSSTTPKVKAPKVLKKRALKDALPARTRHR